VNTFRTIFLSAFLALIAGPAQSAIVTQQLSYAVDGETMIGYFTYDDRLTGPRPGVLVFHEWWGLNDFARRQADALAAKGYRVLAADMYGRGVQTHDAAEAGSLAGAVRGKDLFRTRAEGALEALMKQPNVDPARIGAVGYCFGGTTALELAYSGAPVKGVVSVHGGLTAPRETDQHIRSAILVLTGAADPYVKREEIVAFQDGMERTGADWTMITFGGAMHGFSNPEASRHEMPGVAFDARVAERAWQDTLAFLTRALGPGRE
jgi:dienelactone hydrolase